MNLFREAGCFHELLRHTNVKPLACISFVAKLSRAENTAGKMEDTDGWWEQGKVRHARGGGVSHLGGQTSVYPQDSQYRTLQTVHFTDWSGQALQDGAGNRQPLAVYPVCGWREEKTNMNDVIWHSYTRFQNFCLWLTPHVVTYSACCTGFVWFIVF